MKAVSLIINCILGERMRHFLVVFKNSVEKIFNKVIHFDDDDDDDGLLIITIKQCLKLQFYSRTF